MAAEASGVAQEEEAQDGPGFYSLSGKARDHAHSLDRRRSKQSSGALPAHLVRDKAQTQNKHASSILPSIALLRQLQDRLGSSIPSQHDGKPFEEVWQLYLQLSADQRTPELQRDLLNFLSFSKRQEERVRSVLLLDKLDDNIYWKDILANLHRGSLDDAVATHNFAINTHHDGYVGSDVLLAHAVQRQNWATALHIFNSRMTAFASRGNKTEATQSATSIWRFVDRLPDLAALVSTYAKNVQQEKDKAQARDFLRQLASCVLLNGQLTQLDLRKVLLQELETLKLVDSSFFEAALGSISAKISRRTLGQEYRRARAYFFHLYSNYRRLLSGKPNPEVLYGVLRMLNHRQNPGPPEVSPQYIEEDLRGLGSRIPRSASIHLMALYARAGDAASVQKCFDALAREEDDGPALRRPLISVHAKMAETAEAQQQFDRILAETGQEPDLGCWNALINAYIQADDLQGVLSCFNRLDSTSLRLDQHTFTPILQIFAERGEPEHVIEYLEKAKRRRIRLTADMLSSLVLAHIKHENLAAAEEALRTLSDAKANEDLKDALTKSYNYLLTTYATRRDMQNVLRLFKQMQQTDVPSDSSTYGALVQVLCLTHHTAAAQKLVDTIMPSKGIPVLPFHFALLMAGYNRQDQRAKALAVMDRMKKLGMQPDASVRTAFLRASSWRTLNDSTSDQHRAQVREKMEENTRSLSTSGDPSLSTTQGPALGLSYLNPQNMKDAYFESLLINSGKGGGREMVQKLTQDYEKMRTNPSKTKEQPSLRVLAALITAHSSFGEHSKVQEYWDRYVETVVRLFGSKPENTSSSVTQRLDRRALPTESSLQLEPIDAPTMPSLDVVKVPPSRRDIFSRPLVPYIHSLAAQTKFNTIYTTIYTLLDAGFTLNNLAWNAYITNLSQSANPAHIITAFRTCEEKLMPQFPGWTKNAKRVVKHRERRAKYARAFEYMDVKFGREQLWLGLLRPMFRTLLDLRGVLERIERAEVRGAAEFEWTAGSADQVGDAKSRVDSSGGDQEPQSTFARLNALRAQARSKKEERKVVLTVDGMALVAPLTVHAAQTIPEVALSHKRWWPHVQRWHDHGAVQAKSSAEMKEILEREGEIILDDAGEVG